MTARVHDLVEELISNLDIYISVSRVWMCQDNNPATSVLCQVTDPDSGNEWWVYLDDEKTVRSFPGTAWNEGFPPFVHRMMTEMNAPISALTETA